MLISEILIENALGDDQSLVQNLDDILLRLKKSNVDQVPLDQLARELDRLNGPIYLNINDPESKDQIIRLLNSNPNVETVTDDDQVVIKKTGSVPTENGEDAAKDQEQQQNKVQKIASKNVKTKSQDGGI